MKINMSSVVLFGIFLGFCATSYGDLKGALPVGAAIDRKDNRPLLFMLDKNGMIHTDDQPRHTITGREQRQRLRMSRRKRPLGEVLDEAVAKKIGVKPDIYGGEAMTLREDTAVPDVPGDDKTDSYGYPTGPTIEQRYKRQVGRFHEVETLLIFDYALYQFWLKRNGNNATLAKDEMLDYYSNIINAVNGRYETLSSPFFSVRMSITGFIIADSPTATPWTQSLNMSNTIDSIASINLFTAWVNQNRASLPPHDHAITVTGFDLARDGRTGLVGLANQNRTCTSESVSLVEELRNQETATLIAHELAHSIGAYHDGDRNLCSNDAIFIMSTKIAVPDKQNANHPWTFSSCSAASIMEYLALTPTQCTLRKSGISQDLSPYLQEEFGQKYPVDVQCELYRGVGSKFCRSVYVGNLTYADLCYTLYCLDPEDGLCYPTLAHDGTTCGNNQWCRSGICTFSTQAPLTPENCPAGNDPDVSCMTTLCSNSTVRDVLCCATCKPTPVPPVTSPPVTRPPVTRPPFIPPVHPRPPVKPQNPFQSQNPFSFNDFFSFDLFNRDPFNFQNNFDPFRQNNRPNRPSKPKNKYTNSFRPGSSQSGYNAYGNLQNEMGNVFANFDDQFPFDFGACGVNGSLIITNVMLIILFYMTNVYFT